MEDCPLIRHPVFGNQAPGTLPENFLGRDSPKNLVYPRLQVAVSSRCTIEPGQLLAISIENKGWCRLDRETLGKKRLGIDINSDDFKPSSPPLRKIIDEGFKSSAVATPPCPEFGKNALRPLIDMPVITCRRHVDRRMREVERNLALSTNRMARQFIVCNAVQCFTVPAAQDNIVVPHATSSRPDKFSLSTVAYYSIAMAKNKTSQVSVSTTDRNVRLLSYGPVS